MRTWAGRLLLLVVTAGGVGFVLGGPGRATHCGPCVHPSPAPPAGHAAPKTAGPTEDDRPF